LFNAGERKRFIHFKLQGRDSRWDLNYKKNRQFVKKKMVVILAVIEKLLAYTVDSLRINVQGR